MPNSKLRMDNQLI